MNVFDYWIDNQNEDDSRWDTVWGISPANRGINENHNLKFHRYDADVSAVKGDLNSYLGARVVNQGIVQNTLGEDGYPRLSSANGGESLAYLFDPSVLQTGKASYTGATSSSRMRTATTSTTAPTTGRCSTRTRGGSRPPRSPATRATTSTGRTKAPTTASTPSAMILRVLRSSPKGTPQSLHFSDAASISSHRMPRDVS